MPSDDLIALWARIEADLRRARSYLPPDADSNAAIREYQEYLDHNELELACDMLEQCGEEHHAGSTFWLALSDAAAKMELSKRADEYAARANRP